MILAGISLDRMDVIRLEKMQNLVIQCEESIEGIFTAIYEAYEQKKKYEDVFLQMGAEGEFRLFTEYTVSTPDSGKASKVIRTVLREFGEEVYTTFCQALATPEPERGDAVYHAIVLGYTMKNKRSLMDNLANSYVNKVFRMGRQANNEILHMKGFLRFSELESGLLFSEIGPKNNIITFLAPHFADRLPGENFIIYDSSRDIAVLHAAFKEWVVVSGEGINLEEARRFSEQEMEYQAMFQYFCQKIAIADRVNKNLQRQMLPLRFREYMIEF